LISGFVIRNVQKKRTAEKVAILEKQNAIETMRTKLPAMCMMKWAPT
jgi:hypothetical protein